MVEMDLRGGVGVGMNQGSHNMSFSHSESGYATVLGVHRLV